MSDKLQIFPKGALEKIIVLGAGQLSVTVAEYCRENDLELSVIGAPRQQDACLPDGTPVQQELKSLGVDVEVVSRLQDCECGPYEATPEDTLVFSLGSPFIIQQDLIGKFKGRIINSHGAPLPEWRGGGGFSWRIMAGDRRGNVCFHLLTEGIDEGDVVYEEAYEFPDDARIPRDYMNYAFEMNRKGLVCFLEAVSNGETFSRRIQDPAKSTYFPRLDTSSQAYIDWSWSGPEIERFILAFSHPYSGAMTFHDEETVHIFEARFIPQENGGHPFFSGLVVRSEASGYAICCRDGLLEVELDDIQSSGEVRLGNRLHTPVEYLLKAQAARPRFTPVGRAD